MFGNITKTLIVLLVGIFLFSCSQENKKITSTFTYDPVSPQSGKEVTIYFVPDSSQLSGSEKIDAIIYEYDVVAEKVTAVPMKKTDNYFAAKFTPSQTTKGLIIKFRSGKKEDFNKKHGYVIFMTDGNGDPVPGAKAGSTTSISIEI